MRINRARYDLEGLTLFQDGEYIAVGEYHSGSYRCEVTEIDEDGNETSATTRLLTPVDLIGAETI